MEIFDTNDATLLAIVIPAFKSMYLKEALDSIVNQTDKRFRVYLGDDCSPYDIENIVNDYKDKIPLTYKRFESNLGGKDLVAQWERCINLTKGEPYIWLFSDDDTMESRCVEMFYNFLDSHPYDQLFHFNINMIDDLNEGKIKSLNEFPSKLSASQYLEAKLRGKIVSYVIEFIFSRKIYEEIGGFQKFDLAWGSDFITWLKMSSISNNGISTIQGENSKVCWRRSSENISPNKSHPIIIRKIKSLINNALIINKELTTNQIAYMPLKRSFRWLRFPLGEIYRNKKSLSNKEIKELCYLYYKKIGYPLQTVLSYLIIMLHRNENK